MKQVKSHFEEEAEIFDDLIRTLIPGYEDMIESMILALPFLRIKIHVMVLPMLVESARLMIYNPLLL